MKKAYGYLRVSGKGQTGEDKDGFKRQEQAIRDYAKVNGIDIAQIFKEEGVSGAEESRETLARMMVALEENGVQTVIIEKLDRLARDLMVQESIVRDFKSKDIELMSKDEGADLASNDPTRKLLRQFMGAIAEYDKDMTVRKLRVARERKRAENGKCEGRKGAKESEEGLALIKKVKSLGRKPRNGKKLTHAQMAKRLNDEGTTTITGKPWTAVSVQRFLHRL